MAANGTGVEAGVARGAAECQGRHTQRQEKCQDVNANKKQWCDDDTSRGCSGDSTAGGSGGGGGGGGDGDSTPRKQGQPGDKYSLHHHQEEEMPYKLVPPDGGWGWMVVLGTFIIVILLPSLGPSFGILFSGYLLDAGSSSTTTAWIFNLQCFLWFTSGLLTRPLTQELGWRPVGMTGSAMASVGLLLCAFTPNPKFLFFSFSILTGIGGGLVTCQCFTILPHYFQRHRGLTNAIMMSGICLGQILVPLVARYLQNKYGFRGATLIMAGVTFNSCIGASFFHPFEWHQKKVMVEEEPKEHVAVLPVKSKAMDSPHLTRELIKSPSKSSFVGSTVEAESEGGLVVKAVLLRRFDGLKVNTSSSNLSSRYNSTLSLSSMDVGNLAVMPLDDEEETDAEAHKGRGDSFAMRIVKSTMKDLAVLRSLRACILCFGAVMCINGFLNFIMMVPFSMQEMGFSKDTSAWGLSVAAGCNLVTRFMVSVLTDFPHFNKRLCYLSGFVLLASTILAFTFFTDAKWLLATMALYGVGVGACMGIYNIVLIDVMGMELLASVFGSSCFCVAIGFTCIGPLIGFIRDVTQSYAVSMRITAGMLLIALLAWMFMNVAERFDRRRENAKTMNEKEWQT